MRHWLIRLKFVFFRLISYYNIFRQFFLAFEYKSPVSTDWIYIILIGIVTQLGQYYLTKSLQSEKIAKVSILNYLGIIYALFFGWWMFDEHQHLSTLFGILLVVGGVVVNILIANKKNSA
jgi:drug/metabolite transporter (DMT)-like permease